MSAPSVDALQAGIVAGDRVLLARAITLVESARPEDQRRAEELSARLWSRTGGAVRVGISGVPGAGKSTLIDALGMMLLGRGHRVAVLAVDPSSQVSGGSILGDKTRMSRLAADPRAFIRPSPASGTLGGVARRTREAVLLCEAAGFDVVLVETVGVGQSEAQVADLVDVFLLVLLAGAGDELQGIKRGILERIDVLAINKADGPGQAAAQAAAAEYRQALRLLRGEEIPVFPISATTGIGLQALWDELAGRVASARADGTLESRRRGQLRRWMWSLFEELVVLQVRQDAAFAATAAGLEAQVESGARSPTAAARELVRALLPKS